MLVDNNSSDDSIQKIKDYSKGKLTVKSKFFNFDPDNKPIEVSQYSTEELESIENH